MPLRAVAGRPLSCSRGLNIYACYVQHVMICVTCYPRDVLEMSDRPASKCPRWSAHSRRLQPESADIRYVCMNICMYVCMHTCIHVYVHTHTFIHTPACKHAYKHIPVNESPAQQHTCRERPKHISRYPKALQIHGEKRLHLTPFVLFCFFQCCWTACQKHSWPRYASRYPKAFQLNAPENTRRKLIASDGFCSLVLSVAGRDITQEIFT